MADAIRRDDAGKIFSMLKECHKSLQRGNIYSCLIAFSEVLEKINSTRMISADDKALRIGINTFQRELASSSLFRDAYGPVTLRDNDFAPSMALMKQLIEIKEEEINELVAAKEVAQASPNGSSNREDIIAIQVIEIKKFIEQGDYATAQEMLVNREDLLSIIVDDYNGAGIVHRRAGRYDEALSTFKKIIAISQQDEGLYYNIARVYVCKREWKTAAEMMQSALRINPEFEEAIKMLKYIRETGNVELD